MTDKPETPPPLPPPPVTSIPKPLMTTTATSTSTSLNDLSTSSKDLSAKLDETNNPIENQAQSNPANNYFVTPQIDAEKSLGTAKDPPMEIFFDMENFFNYWVTSSANACSTLPENDDTNKFLKKSIVKVLMESMAELQTEHGFNKIEPKSSFRSTSPIDRIEFGKNKRPNDRVSLFFTRVFIWDFKPLLIVF